jgi:hypothetical protein
MEGRGHPPEGRMAAPLLDIRDGQPCIVLLPAPDRFFGSEAELDDEGFPASYSGSTSPRFSRTAAAGRPHLSP